MFYKNQSTAHRHTNILSMRLDSWRRDPWSTIITASRFVWGPSFPTLKQDFAHKAPPFMAILLDFENSRECNPRLLIENDFESKDEHKIKWVEISIDWEKTKETIEPYSRRMRRNRHRMHYSDQNERWKLSIISGFWETSRGRIWRP